MSDDAPPEPDRAPGTPHPREAARLFGQHHAESQFLAALSVGRLHHAWLIMGPKGVGKATLAWRMARVLLTDDPNPEAGLFGDAEPRRTLDTDPDHPVIRRMMAGSEGRLFLLRRGWDEKAKRLRAEITVDETRGLKSFFGLSAADGGRRVVIVDAAEDMNPSAANAILKVLEEPPKDAVLLLVCHQPAWLLPTIRSRCRTLSCPPLGASDMADALAQAEVAPGEGEAGALAELSGGSVGLAAAMVAEEGPALYARIMDLMAGAPKLDRAAAIKIADAAGARGAESRRDLTMALIETFLARLARTGAGHAPQHEAAPREAEQLARLAPHLTAGQRWATLQQTLSDRMRRGIGVNLDASGLILDTLIKVNETAAEILDRP